jgi:hypothetical protein
LTFILKEVTEVTDLIRFQGEFFNTVIFLPEIRKPWPTWTIFDQNRGGNSTARVRPFLNEFRPKKITVNKEQPKLIIFQ